MSVKRLETILARQVAMILAGPVIAGAVISLVVGIVQMNADLRSQMVSRAESAVETMRREIEYALHAGIPVHSLRGVPDYAKELADETPEVLALRFHAYSTLEKMQLRHLIMTEMAPEAQAGEATALEVLRSEAALVWAVLSQDKNFGLRDVAFAQVRAFGEPVGRVTAELDMSYLRSRVLGTFLDTSVLIVAAIVLLIEVLLVLLVMEVIGPVQAVGRYLGKLQRGDLRQVRLRRTLRRSVAVIRIMQARNMAMLERTLSLPSAPQLQAFLQRTRLAEWYKLRARPIGEARLVLFLALFSEALLISWMPLHVRELTATTQGTDVSPLVAAPIVAFAGMLLCMTMTAPVWMKQRRLRPLVLFGLALLAVGQLAAVIADSVWTLIAARMLAGVGLGVAQVTLGHYRESENGDAKDIESVTSFRRAPMTAMISGLAIGPLMANWTGYYAVFAMAAAVTAVAAAFALLLMHPKAHGDYFGRTLRQRVQPISAIVLHNPTLRVLIGQTFPIAMMHGGFSLVIVPLWLLQMGFSQSEIGHVLTAQALLTVLTYTMSKRFFEAVQGMQGALSLVLMAALALMAGLVAFIGLSGPSWAIVVLILLTGVLIGASYHVQSTAFSTATAGYFTTTETGFQKSLAWHIGDVAAPVIAGIILAIATLGDAPLIIAVYVVAVFGLSLVLSTPHLPQRSTRA